MIPPQWFSAAARDAEKMYEQLNTEITKDIARRIVKTGMITESSEWQIRKVQESGKLMDDVIADVAHYSGKSLREVEKLFKDAGVTAVTFGVYNAQQAGIPAMPRLSPSMRQVLDADIAKTKGDLKNLTMTTAATSQDTFINAMNEAQLKVESGAFSYERAIRDAVDQCVGVGAQVLYSDGNRMSLEAAARMCVMTGLSQTTGKISEMNCEELGAEYVEVSAHFGARPSHEEWQGQVYQLHGSSAQYDNFYDATQYGDVTGLCGVNCRHSFYPFFPGISERAYTPEMLKEYESERYEYDGKGLTEYEAAQKMRQMERNIRESKRKVEGLKAAIGECTDTAVKAELEKSLAQAQSTLQSRSKRLNGFCKQTGLERDYSRTRVAQEQGIGKVKGQQPIKQFSLTSKDIGYRPKRGDYKDDDAYFAAREKRAQTIEQTKAEWMSAERSFTTRGEIEAWAKSAGVHVDESVFRNVDLRVMDEIVSTINETRMAYPEVFQYHENDGRMFMIRFVGNGDYLMEASGGLNLGPAFSDLGNVYDQVIRQQISGNLVMGDGTFKTVVRHELGHSLNNYVVKERFSIDGPLMFDEKKARVEALASFNRQLENLANVYGSDYAKEKPTEAFAEGFAAFTSDPNDEFGLKWYDLYQRMVSWKWR